MSDAPDPPALPPWLERSAAIAWRILVVAAAVIAVGFVLIEARVVVIPLIVALFIAAVLGPPAAWLMDRNWPPLLATWAVVLAALVVVGGIGWLVVPEIVDDIGEVGDALSDAVDEVEDWLVDGPPGLSEETVRAVREDIGSAFRGTAGSGGLFDRATLALEIVAGLLLTFVIGFFYVKDGRRFRDAFLGQLPDRYRPRARRGMTTGWTVLRRYLAGVAVVGVVDATAIGIGLLIIGVPLVVPLMVITFLAALFPLVGAVIAGAMASLVALGAGGVVDALLVAAVATAVQQIDGDVVAPLVYSKAVALHPLAVLLALATGAALGGIVGAFLAVPVLAVVLAVRRSWNALDEQTAAS